MQLLKMIRKLADYTIDLGSPRKVVFRTDLPLVAQDPITSEHPSGDYLYGLGDADFRRH